MVESYWQIGKNIVEYEQSGNSRAEYGKYVIKDLSERLTKSFGKGFTVTNLKYMRQFYTTFSICHAVSDKLRWDFCLLIKIGDGFCVHAGYYSIDGKRLTLKSGTFHKNKYF